MQLKAGTLCGKLWGQKELFLVSGIIKKGGH